MHLIDPAPTLEVVVGGSKLVHDCDDSSTGAKTPRSRRDFLGLASEICVRLFEGKAQGRAICHVEQSQVHNVH